MLVRSSALETFWVFLKLGVTCFGGPVAHLGYFHEEFVVRRKWLDEQAYANLVALCQFLPGPASSQVGMAIGLHRSGWLGALAAWLGFTLPSAVIMTAFGYGVMSFGHVERAGWLGGLKLAAVAVVAQAVWIMGSKFCREKGTVLIALVSTAMVLAWASGFFQIIAIGGGSLLGWLLYRNRVEIKVAEHRAGKLDMAYGPRTGGALVAIFFLLLIGLPACATTTHDAALAVFAGFYRAGSLVFGGGHVVLPLLQAGVVRPGWVGDDQFLAGYGVAQALPGPLFSFAAFLGAVMKPEPHGWVGAVWCLIAIYIPAALLVFGALPFWAGMRRQAFAQAMLKGTDAAVVGLLLAALCRMIATAIHGPVEFIMALAAFALLVFCSCPPWLVVSLSALGGWLFFP